jgi:hypothetical protein
MEKALQKGRVSNSQEKWIKTEGFNCQGTRHERRFR